MPVREKGTNGAGSRTARPFSRPVHVQSAAKPRASPPTALEFTTETDSVLEGDGFELSVPRKRHNKFDVTRPHAGTESSYPTPKSWFPKVIPRGDNRRLCRKLGNPGRSIPYKQPTPSLIQEWSAICTRVHRLIVDQTPPSHMTPVHPSGIT